VRPRAWRVLLGLPPGSTDQAAGSDSTPGSANPAGAVAAWAEAEAAAAAADERAWYGRLERRVAALELATDGLVREEMALGRPT
jgi:hypothetical protein